MPRFHLAEGNLVLKMHVVSAMSRIYYISEHIWYIPYIRDGLLSSFGHRIDERNDWPLPLDHYDQYRGSFFRSFCCLNASFFLVLTIFQHIYAETYRRLPTCIHKHSYTAIVSCCARAHYPSFTPNSSQMSHGYKMFHIEDLCLPPTMLVHHISFPPLRGQPAAGPFWWSDELPRCSRLPILSFLWCEIMPFIYILSRSACLRSGAFHGRLDLFSLLARYARVSAATAHKVTWCRFQ